MTGPTAHFLLPMSRAYNSGCQNLDSENLMRAGITMYELDQRDRELLTALQNELPLVSTPYAVLGQQLDMSEKEVIKRSERLRREGILRHVGGVFDSRSLGYRSCLVAARADQEKIDRAASVINVHPGVTQNYARNHTFNLWFTIAVPPDSTLGLEKTVDLLATEAECQATRLLPTLRLFKSGADGESINEPSTEAAPLTPGEVEVVRLLQHDFPLQPRPFDVLARGTSVTGEEILSGARTMQKRQQLRRIAATVQQKRNSFSSTAMAVWRVPADRVEEICPQMAEHRAVSQCFLRPTFDDWPYNVFTTIHGRSVDECETVASEIAELTGIDEVRVLFPVKEYKRGKLAYFTPDILQWERSRGGEAASSTSVAS